MSAIAAHPEESQQQGWAEWWHQHHTAPTINTSTHTAKPLTTKLPRYRPNLDDALAEDSGPAWHLNRDRLLNFARRGAWMVENLPPTDEAVLRRWKETIEAAAPAPLISLTTTNIVQNMSDAIKADTGSWPMQSHSFGTQLDTPSLLLMRQTHTECSEAISEYLDAHEGLDLPWTQQRGLALTSENDHSDLPGLQKQKHFNFLSRLLGRLPGGFRKLDASRPWMFYWVLNSFATMNIDFKSSEELIQTLTPIQNRCGGFGGGQGQYSHLATTYASILALVSSGTPPAAMQFIDRRELYEWLGRLKQRNGAFAMAEGGETDVRAVYIVLVLLTLFNLPHTLPETSSAARAAGHRTFQDGVGQYIRACQSFEGGLGCAPSTEAHGAYTFCGIAALCLLDPWQGPKGTIHKYLDFDALLQWVLWRQDDITGGLAGRTNKLVDNCYSHWIGGCWSLLESAIPESPELFNRSSLALYILACGQAPYGGLRDKPSHDSDAYHSCYGLAGLSATMYRWQYVDGQWLHTPITRGAADSPPDLRPLHPVYVVPMEEAMATEEYFKLRPLA